MSDCGNEICSQYNTKHRNNCEVGHLNPNISCGEFIPVKENRSTSSSIEETRIVMEPVTIRVKIHTILNIMEALSFCNDYELKQSIKSDLEEVFYRNKPFYLQEGSRWLRS